MLNYRNAGGQRKTKWISLGLSEKGNKRKAEAELARLRAEFEPPKEVGDLSSDMLFADYLLEWLEIAKGRLAVATFPKFLEDHGLRRMRFHDLRHSCASLLLANGVPLKHIQEWLGHSDFTTTANIYAHLDYKSKITSAQAMETGLALPEGGDFGSRWGSIDVGENG